MFEWIEMKIKKFILCVLVIYSVSASAFATDLRFVQKLKLSPTQTVVIAEGDLEARSIGSYSVRLYASENNEETTFFQVGIIYERDGVIEKIALADIDGDGRAEIVVIVRSVGSGNYLSAQAFRFNQQQISLRASVSGLPATTDPFVALKQAKKLC